KITKININTAPKSVLLALADWMTPEIAQAWLEKRLLKPADKVETFRSFIVAQTGFKQDEINTALPDTVISVNTDFFLLVGQFDYGSVQQQVDALLHRESSKQVSLWQRWFSQVKDE
ncbi:MAG: general secretion pathway protein GspK, partial [Thiomicrospira sp.]|nr:general secretion pathway protein GspK [Thiomicrospira sp.]